MADFDPNAFPVISETALRDNVGLKSSIFTLAVNPQANAQDLPNAQQIRVALVDRDTMEDYRALPRTEIASGIVLMTSEQLQATLNDLNTFRSGYESRVSGPVVREATAYAAEAGIDGKEKGRRSKLIGEKKREILAPSTPIFEEWNVKAIEKLLKDFEKVRRHEKSKAYLKETLAQESPTLGVGFAKLFEHLKIVYDGTPGEHLVAKMEALPLSADNIVCLAEMANYTAKYAKHIRRKIDEKDSYEDMSADTDPKELVTAGSKLMGAAKNVLLQAATIEEIFGDKTARAYTSGDANGEPVVLLTTPHQRIGLHAVDKAICKTFPVAEEHGIIHQDGFRRQWLAPITMAALANGDTDIVNAITEASVDPAKAANFNAAMVGIYGEDNYKNAMKALIEEAPKSIKSDGTLDRGSKLVQALQELGKSAQPNPTKTIPGELLEGEDRGQASAIGIKKN